jgi:molybdopterin-guanine dinucleotide biosynthesis protein A
MNSGAKNPITGFVLAGGESTRMGSDKAFLQVGGETLLARAMRLAGAVSVEVRIVGSASTFGSYGTVVEDIFPRRGPLGGIHAALNGSATDLNLILAVDLPFVEVRFLENLVSRAQTCDATVTVPRAGGGWQPLCAVYRKAFAEVAEAALRQGKNKIDALFASVKTEIIEEDELTRVGFSPAMFRNLNTPEDWKHAQHHL